tara:strand:+ start:6273 stop:6854 length:582 start_codon:yes stop_codon:yes gene_type:complete
MLIHIDEFDTIKLVEKAYVIGDFRKLYEHIISLADEELALSAFAYLHYMFHFDSRFFLMEPDEKKRSELVKKFVHRGKELKPSGRIFIRAVDLYRELYNEEQNSLYRVMHNNLFKLRDYAENMTLVPLRTEPNEDGEMESIGDGTYVDSKEFAMVNSLLPKQQKDLEDFGVRLIEANKNKIDIYGGKEENIYE